METHWAHLDGEMWEHVLLNTGEAALAGRGAERTRGEPPPLTKARSMLGIFSFFASFASTVFLAVSRVVSQSPLCLSLTIIPHQSTSPFSSSSFYLCPVLTANKTARSLFSGEFITSYFPIHIIPFKRATSNQPVTAASQPVRYPSSRSLSLSVKSCYG